jgi:flagellar biosynthesis/type III secretory pathway M-ring protein FliF/YscJ
MIRVKTLKSEQKKVKAVNSLVTRKSCGLGRARVVVVNQFLPDSFLAHGSGNLMHLYPIQLGATTKFDQVIK